MPDFKLYGSPDPTAVIEAGVMTQGIGFPLRQVDNAPAPLAASDALRVFSNVTQEPVALDTPIQVSFGPPTTTDEFDLDVSGNITCLVADDYQARLRLQMGRTGNPGVAITFMRVLLNGTQLGNSVATRLDDADNVVPTTFTGNVVLAVNDVLTVEIYRDSAGANAGGVFAEAATLAGWADSPSTTVVLTKIVAGDVVPTISEFSL